MNFDENFENFIDSMSVEELRFWDYGVRWGDVLPVVHLTFSTQIPRLTIFNYNGKIRVLQLSVSVKHF